MLRTTQKLQERSSVFACPPTKSRQETHAKKFHGEPSKTGQRNQIDCDGFAKRVNRARPEVVEHQTDRHHRENPNEEQLFFRTHGHPPRPLASSAGPEGPTGTEANVRPS